MVADSTDDSPFPAPGTAPSAVFVSNPSRPDIATALSNVLFVLDAGTQAGSVSVAATISGMATPLDLSASITVSATPAGDAKHGATVYAANCATCHGDTGHGTDAQADGSFLIQNKSYDFPAPGLNDETGNVAQDPDWNPALLAVASRADLDNGGITLRLPMLNWLSAVDATTNQPLTTQDFADIYAFMATQSN